MPNSRVARNYFLLSAGELAAKVCTFLAYTSLGRGLGPERYGDIEFAISTTLFFALFVQFGLGSYGARELARAPERVEQLVGEMVQLRLWTGALAYCIVLVLAASADKATDSRLLVAAYGVTLIEAPGLLIWYFQGREEMGKAAWTSLTRHVVFSALALGVMESTRPLWLVGVFEIMALGAAVAVGVFLAGRIPRPSWDAAAVWGPFRAAAGIGVAELAGAGLWFLPVVVYGFTRSDASVGWLGSSHRATLAIHTFAWWYFFNLLPAVSRCAPHRTSELAALIGGSMRLTLWAGFLVAACTSLLARPLVDLAYGEEFASAGPLLALMIWTIPLSVVSGHYRSVLIGFDRQRALLTCTILSAATSAGATAWAAGVFGVRGAVYGLLAGNACLAVSTMWAVHEGVVKIDWGRAAAWPVIGVGLAVAAARPIGEGSPFVSAAAAATVIAAAFLFAERRQLEGWRQSVSAWIRTRA